MKKLSITDGVQPKPEPINVPVAVCFTEKDKLRWDNLNERLKRLGQDPKTRPKLSVFGRKALLKVMDDVEKLLEDQAG